MKIKLENMFILSICLFFLFPAYANAANYTIKTGTTDVDGSTFCGGSPCTSADTITIQGGARDRLNIHDFDGGGDYIVFRNEDTNPDSQVVITKASSGYGAIHIYDCQYVDIAGNGDADLTYGVKVINAPVGAYATAVWVRGESDYIKIGYMEITCEGMTGESGSGIKVGDDQLTDSSVFDTFEIHHNFIHNTRYAGMYLGHNKPWDENLPYVTNFSVHDNLLEDMGAYGITLKGVKSTSGVCSIYRNIIRAGKASNASTGLVTARGGGARHGIGVQYFEGEVYSKIYGNTIHNTKGPGLKIGDQLHYVYENSIIGCGSDNEDKWGHGIVLYQSTYGTYIFDNNILKSGRYGIFAQGTTATKGAFLSGNIIKESGLGEWGEMQTGDIYRTSEKIYLPKIVSGFQISG